MVKFVLHFGFLVAGVTLLARRSLRFYWLALAAFLGGIALNALYGVVQLALAELVGANLDAALDRADHLATPRSTCSGRGGRRRSSGRTR